MKLNYILLSYILAILTTKVASGGQVKVEIEGQEPYSGGFDEEGSSRGSARVSSSGQAGWNASGDSGGQGVGSGASSSYGGHGGSAVQLVFSLDTDEMDDAILKKVLLNISTESSWQNPFPFIPKLILNLEVKANSILRWIFNAIGSISGSITQILEAKLSGQPVVGIAGPFGLNITDKLFVDAVSQLPNWSLNASLDFLSIASGFFEFRFELVVPSLFGILRTGAKLLTQTIGKMLALPFSLLSLISKIISYFGLEAKAHIENIVAGLNSIIDGKAGISKFTGVETVDTVITELLSFVPHFFLQIAANFLVEFLSATDLLFDRQFFTDPAQLSNKVVQLVKALVGVSTSIPLSIVSGIDQEVKGLQASLYDFLGAWVPALRSIATNRTKIIPRIFNNWLVDSTLTHILALAPDYILQIAAEAVVRIQYLLGIHVVADFPSNFEELYNVTGAAYNGLLDTFHEFLRNPDILALLNVDLFVRGVTGFLRSSFSFWTYSIWSIAVSIGNSIYTIFHFIRTFIKNWIFGGSIIFTYLLDPLLYVFYAIGTAVEEIQSGMWGFFLEVGGVIEAVLPTMLSVTLSPFYFVFRAVLGLILRIAVIGLRIYYTVNIQLPTAAAALPTKVLEELALKVAIPLMKQIVYFTVSGIRFFNLDLLNPLLDSIPASIIGTGNFNLFMALVGALTSPLWAVIVGIVQGFIGGGGGYIGDVSLLGLGLFDFDGTFHSGFNFTDFISFGGGSEGGSLGYSVSGGGNATLD